MNIELFDSKGISPTVIKVVGVGGGKAIDAAKAAAAFAGLRVVVVPTIASNDAPTSACTVWSAPTTYTKVPLPRRLLIQTGSSSANAEAARRWTCCRR